MISGAPIESGLAGICNPEQCASLCIEVIWANSDVLERVTLMWRRGRKNRDCHQIVTKTGAKRAKIFEKGAHLTSIRQV